jgi:outer membrane protein
MMKRKTKMKMKLFFLNAVFVSCTFFATAQNKLTLQQAIETGIANNILVGQADLQQQAAAVNYRQAKANMLPDLNGTVSHGINQGRSIDPFTNSYINQKVNYASYTLGSGILLFNGLSLQNNVKRNALAYEASQMELQQAKDNLTINVILAYLQVLSAQDILEQSQSLEKVTRNQVERLNILNTAGAISPSEFYDLKGQLANDELSIVDNQAAVETAKLNLVQLLNIPCDKNLQLERLAADAFTNRYDALPANIYETALHNFALIKSVRLRSQSAERAIRAAKGELFPSLSLNGNLNSNYSSAATQDIFLNTIEVPTSDYVVVNGSNLPVITKQNKYNPQRISYSSQLNNNLFTSVNLGLRIPLFNANQVKNKIKLAKIDLKNAELVEKNTKVELQQSVERAYVNMKSAADKYKILSDQVNSFTESFRAAEIKFNAGAINSVDYLIAKNNLDRSNIHLVIAKYEFMLRAKILDYYQGKPLW